MAQRVVRAKRIPAVRPDFLLKLGQRAGAKVHFEQAARMTLNRREQELLMARAARCGAEKEA